MSQPRRAAIYARYSTDMQNERSIEDQIDLCRAYAAREGLIVVDVFEDKAVSGASMHNRPGIKSLLAQSATGRFNVVLAESMSRIARDQEDRAAIRKRLQFQSITLMTPSDGVVTPLTDSIRAVIDSQYLEDLKGMIRRGMTGLAKQGKSAGGRAYGYRADPFNKGELLVVEHEAEIVQHIFRSFTKSVSPQKICHELNARRVLPPRGGGHWHPSALLGMEARGSGILRNSIYVGRPVWNKNRMLKDPDTGKRISRPNPPEDRLHQDVPHLRLVSDELFEKAQAMLIARSHRQRDENFGVHKRPQYLLSGLLKCAACGSGMVRCGKDKSGKTRLKCSLHRGSKSCPNPKSFYAEDVEALVIDSLTKELASPSQIYSYAETFMEERHAKAAHENQRRKAIESRLKAIEKESSKLVDLMIGSIGDVETLGVKSKELGRERDDLRVELASLPEASNVSVHPAAIKHFARKLAGSRAKLEYALHMLDDMGELHPVVRGIIKSVTLSKDHDGVICIYVESFLEPFLAEPGAHEHGFSQSEGYTVGSGGGTRTPDTRIMIPLL